MEGFRAHILRFFLHRKRTDSKSRIFAGRSGHKQVIAAIGILSKLVDIFLEAKSKLVHRFGMDLTDIAEVPSVACYARDGGFVFWKPQNKPVFSTVVFKPVCIAGNSVKFVKLSVLFIYAKVKHMPVWCLE